VVAPFHVYADPGTYTVTLVVHDGENPSDPDSTTATVAVSTGIGGGTTAPLTTRLIGATPNPVAQSSAVRYDLAARAHVRLRIVDVQGRIVRTLVDGIEEPGEHRAEWNGADQAGRRLPAGIYFGEFEAAGIRATRKLLLLP
jgi:flagellar hook assembly protein FlgD